MARPPLTPLLLATLLLAAAPGEEPARAAESAPVRSARSVATLVAEVDQAGAGEAFRIGLRLRLAPGWHTYWRNPGDAGAPAEIALALPAGAAAGPIEWPAPRRIPYGPLVNHGYTGEVLLPLRVTAPASIAPGGTLHIEAEATWLACAEICVPEEGRFRLDLPVVAGPGRLDPRLAPLFTAAEASRPRPSPWTARAAFPAGRGPGSLTLADAALSPSTVREAEFFPDAPGVLDHAAPQPLTLREGSLTLGLARPGGAEAPPPATLSGVLALTDGAGARAAYAVDAPVEAAPAGPAAAVPGLWPALAWAFLGGLILNLMPCVFPVLAMKAMGLARLSGAARAEVRAHAASYTAGVVATFLALGGLLVALRAAGVVAGWGFQFTAPAFVAALAWLMLAVGLNLSGVFAVGGAAAAAGAGGALAARGGHLGSAATGALAVLVATPCTAPFMAAAVGAALAMPAAAGLAVFGALGLGLAAPTALLGLRPGLARALPRPGPWMERLRQALAFPMYGAAAWLAWVLAQVGGPEGLAFVLAGGVLVGFAAWALGAAQRSAGPRGRGVARAAAAAAAVGALALLPGLAAAPVPQAPLGGAPEAGGAAAAVVGEEPWSAARVAALRAEGRPVFVNLTAAWCITCQVNERLALRGDAVRDAFAARGVAVLKGDWTGGDAAIGALLRGHGREGVPLYLLYPAGGGPPLVLPQVLTEGIVLRAIAGA
jgi:thiol:disulfide interchange protein DsbD